jgi:hypothetical protein
MKIQMKENMREPKGIKEKTKGTPRLLKEKVGGR